MIVCLYYMIIVNSFYDSCFITYSIVLILPGRAEKSVYHRTQHLNSYMIIAPVIYDIAVSLILDNLSELANLRQISTELITRLSHLVDPQHLSTDKKNTVNQELPVGNRVDWCSSRPTVNISEDRPRYTGLTLLLHITASTVTLVIPSLF